MTRRSEKLAKALIQIALEYSDKDFEEALPLIGNGKMFTTVTRTAGTAFKTRSALKSNEKPKKNDSQPEYLSSIFEKLDIDERNSVKSFIEELNEGKIFNSLSETKRFAEELGVSGVKSSTSRSDIARKIASYMVMISHEERRKIINHAKTLSNPESSLLKWSHVIVKSNSD